MKYCKHCKANINTPDTVCPLCQAELETQENNEYEIFPNIPIAYQKHKLFLRILLFISICIVSTTILINFFFQQSGWWSLIIAGSVAFAWFLIFNILTTRNSLAIIARDVLIVAALLVLIDGLYGFSRWSFNYAIPILFLTSILTIVIISIVQGLYFADFTIYFLSSAFLALLPLIFILTGLVTVLWPSIVCISVGFLSIIALFIFANRSVKDELKRRFHL